MAWKMIEGYKYPYRINEEGRLQRWDKDHWKDIRPYIGRCRDRAQFKMVCADGKRRSVAVVRLMADAWLGGRRKGMCLIHKNGSKMDCGIGNLEWRTFRGAAQLSNGNRRPVVKIDKSGCVVEVYGSIKEAAEANHISRAAMNMRCLRKVADPRRLDGYDYQYEDEKPGRPSK